MLNKEIRKYEFDNENELYRGKGRELGEKRKD